MKLLTMCKSAHINKHMPSVKLTGKPLSKQQVMYYQMNMRMFTRIKWVSKQEYNKYHGL